MCVHTMTVLSLNASNALYMLLGQPQFKLLTNRRVGFSLNICHETFFFIFVNNSENINII